jgi:hypothetical protein
MQFLRTYLVSLPETDVKSGVTKEEKAMGLRQLRNHMLVGCESLPLLGRRVKQRIREND